MANKGGFSNKIVSMEDIQPEIEKEGRRFEGKSTLCEKGDRNQLNKSKGERG